MFSFQSAFHPVFWMHHNNIDRFCKLLTLSRSSSLFLKPDMLTLSSIRSRLANLRPEAPALHCRCRREVPVDALGQRSRVSPQAAALAPARRPQDPSRQAQTPLSALNKPRWQAGGTRAVVALQDSPKGAGGRTVRSSTRPPASRFTPPTSSMRAGWATRSTSCRESAHSSLPVAAACCFCLRSALAVACIGLLSAALTPSAGLPQGAAGGLVVEHERDAELRRL